MNATYQKTLHLVYRTVSRQVLGPWDHKGSADYSLGISTLIHSETTSVRVGGHGEYALLEVHIDAHVTVCTEWRGGVQ